MRVITGFAALAALFVSLSALAQDPPADNTSNQPPASETPAKQPPTDAAAQDEPAGQTPDESPADPAAEPSAGDPKAPAVTEFYKQLEEFKGIVQRLREIQREYKVVKPTGREALEQEFQEKMGDSTSRFEALKLAADAAYVANPADKEVADFIGATALIAGESGKFEKAVAKFKLLAENNYRLEDLADALGRYAFQTADFDTAEKYLKKAEELKRITPTGKERLGRIAEERKLWDEELAARERDNKDAEPLPQVRLKTTQGDVLIELFENDAPNTVANFITLVEAGYYDDLPFMLIQPGRRMAVGRAFPDSPKQVDYTIASEGHGEKFRRHYRGSVSLDWPEAKGKDGGSTEISILLSPERLRDPAKSEIGSDSGMTVFGRVVDGLDALDSFAPFNMTENKQPVDKIIDAEVVRKRAHPYEVKKIEPGKPDETEPDGTKPDDDEGTDEKQPGEGDKPKDGDENAQPGEGDSADKPAPKEDDAGDDEPEGTKPAGGEGENTDNNSGDEPESP